MEVFVALEPELVLEPLPADADPHGAPVVFVVEELLEVAPLARRRQGAAGESGVREPGGHVRADSFPE